MKRVVLIIFALIFILCATPAALADSEPSALGNDQVWRVQLRLWELGYLTGPVTGVADEAYVSALNAFCKGNNLPADAGEALVFDALFSLTALPAPYVSNPLEMGRNLEESPFATGLPLNWSEVAPRLTANATYQVTSCTSGILFQMELLSSDGHAELSPVLAWDEATLISLLGDGSQTKMPVVISVGGLRIAASIQLNALEPVQANGMHIYCLYFHGCTSSFAGIPDAEHEYLIRYASGALTDANSDPSATPMPTSTADALPLTPSPEPAQTDAPATPEPTAGETALDDENTDDSD